MAVHVLQTIATSLQSSPFLTIMIDETTDISNHEQVAIVFRYITDSFQVFEEFIGLYNIDSIGAECLSKVILDSLLRLNLPISKLQDSRTDDGTGFRTVL